MKKIIYSSFVLLLSLTACGPSQSDAVAANDLLVAKITKCSHAEKVFFETCETIDAKAIQSELEKFKSACETTKSEIEAAEVHKDLANLKSSALKLVEAYVASQKDYKEYARLYSIPAEAFTEVEEKLTDDTAEKINVVIDKAYAVFDATQKEFADKYGYVIEKQNH